MKKLAIVLGLALVVLTGTSYAQEKTGDTKKTTSTAPKEGPNGKEAPAAAKKAPEKTAPPEATKGGKKGAEKAAEKAPDKGGAAKKAQ